MAFEGRRCTPTGVRIGRKTYMLDLAGGEWRTDDAGVGDRVIGPGLRASGFPGGLAPCIGPGGRPGVLSGLSGLGVPLGCRLPETA